MWGISRLDEWSSMKAFHVVARPPRVPGPDRRARHPRESGLLPLRLRRPGERRARVAAPWQREDRGYLQISDPGRERRVVQAVGVAGRYVIANLHANHGAEVAPASRPSGPGRSPRPPSRPGEVIVLAGDFNLPDVAPGRLLGAVDRRDRPRPRRAALPCPNPWSWPARTTRARRGGSLGPCTCRGDHRVNFH